jgi:DNA-binding HxlR family transcriptional regulator
MASRKIRYRVLYDEVFVVLELFSTKWTSMVLHTLDARHGGKARNGVLHRSLPGISKKMLTQTLREMEASGLVPRHVEGTVPPPSNTG